ncbi:hypothetical protein Cch01nite_27700 [Cellulomonas chitinilytica]|uniref:Uncharacterized protein n=1 Tax=Cellulomonas chitinilytica TaxID=398759 RepID=A0A919P287_9CELL|nr:hypothetical protein [Cellulomonas chitinilytica]GIG22046.1 hypothetical protein Cch01nite_27700 [Cellulomonas chitinilytica]
MAVTLRTELETLRDRQWMWSFLALVLVMPCVAVGLLLDGFVVRSVVVGTTLLLLLVGTVLARCARELEQLLGATASVPRPRRGRLDV